MEALDIINKISTLEEVVKNFVLDTEHWLFYWISNKEVQDFVKEYPEDYEDKVHLSVYSLGASPQFTITFDEHPNEVECIRRYAVLCTFRDSAKAQWLLWNGKVKDMQIEEKEKELSYHKKKVLELEEELKNLRAND